MKAIEIYREYVRLISEEKLSDLDATNFVVQALLKDVENLIALRHCTRPSACMSCLYEVNTKWNAICRFDSSFKRDGFLALLTEEVKRKIMPQGE